MNWVTGLVLLSAAAWAIEKPIWDVNQTSMEALWSRVVQLHVTKSKGSPTLIGGTVPDMKDFPATSFTGSCTTTAVGETVAIIAAHCTGGNNKISFPIGPSNYTAQCTDSKDYNGNSTADYSLCLTTKPIEGITYETVNLDPDHIKVGDKILLGGYGCTRPGGGGGIDGLFRIGIAEVTRMPSGTNNDIVTRNGAALCYGDSGGAAWSLNPDGSRNRLLSVNSRGDISTTSYLSATHTAQFKRFIDSWTANNPTARVCGYHADAKNCRGAVVEPTEFELQNSDTHLKVKVEPGGKYKATKVKASLEKAGF